MKKLLILIVAAAIFLHFYPQPKLESWFNEQKSMVLAKFSSATDTKVRLKSDKIYLDLKPKFSQFNADEQTFLKELTSSRDSVVEFYEKYCNAQQATPKLHQKNQKLVCDKMNEYQSLF